MNLLRRLLWVIGIFILIVVIISLFLPSNLQMKKSIVIDADKDQIFNQINDLKNWKNWSAWSLKDESIYLDENNYSKNTIGEGAIFTWMSNNEEVGEGELKILKSNQEKIETEINIGFSPINSQWLFNIANEGVEVEWITNIDFGFNPFSKFYGLFMGESMKKDYDLSLKRLKSYTENLPKIHSVKVIKDSVEKTWFLSIRDTIKAQSINNAHGKMYAEINKYMDENNIDVSGSPLVIYHYWSDSIIDIEAGLPIKDSMDVSDQMVRLNKIAAGKVVTAIHQGHYDRLPETYFGINEWMRKNKVVVSGPLWEVYITDPATEPNAEKWKTAIYFPIN